MFSRKGKKLEVICLDFGGAGGSAVWEDSWYDDGGGDVEGVGKSGPSDERTDWPDGAETDGIARA